MVIVNENKTCPICNNDFEASVDLSGFQNDLRLDLKPLGAISAPSLVPVCPHCNFVIYDDNIQEEEKLKCKTIVSSDEYLKNKERSSYYLLGLLYQGLGKDDLSIAHIFLKASWQEESDNIKHKEDLKTSLHYFKQYLSRTTDLDENWASVQTLTGEILRQLGSFELAKEHLKKLLNVDQFKDNLYGRIVKFEILLCELSDSSPHTISEVKRKSC